MQNYSVMQGKILNISMRWQWDDNEMTKRWQWDDNEMTKTTSVCSHFLILSAATT